MKLLQILKIVIFTFGYSVQAQCLSDEIEYVNVYVSNHCTSSSFKSTKAILSPVKKYQFSGTFHWKMRKNSNYLWDELSNSWIFIESTGQIVNNRVESLDIMSEFLLVFTETSTGCTDSCVEKIILDQVPIISISSGILGERKFFTAINNAYSASVSDEITWFNHLFEKYGVCDTLFSSISPCYVKIVDCVGCTEMVYLEACTDKNFIVHPNPTSDIIYLESGKECNVALYDISGKKVSEAHIGDSHSTTINIKAFSGGMYLLRVCDDVEVVVIHH